MTNYKVIKNNNQYIIEVSGHAGSQSNNHDYVCAAISTAIYMTRNSIEMVEPGYNLSGIILDDGYAKFTVEAKYINACKLLEVLEFTLKDLESKFPKYINRK